MRPLLPLPRPVLRLALVLGALALAVPARGAAPCHEAPALSDTGAVCEEAPAPSAVPCRSRPADGPASSHVCCARGHTPAPPSPAPPVPAATTRTSAEPAAPLAARPTSASAPAGVSPGPPCARPILFGQLLN